MSAPSSAPRALRPPAERVTLGLVALTALAAAVRFSTLDVQSFWVDEAVTVHLLQHSFGGMVSAIPDSESTPPLYYALAWVWAKVFGTGEVGLRSLSALFGTATVPLAYLVGARLVSRRAGLVLAALTAVNPLLVWFSQEARAYALLVLLTTAAFAVFAAALERPSTRLLLWWGLFAALALATHYFAIFVLAPQAVWLATRYRRRALPPLAIVAAAGAALLPLLIHQAHNDRADFIRETSLARRVLQVPKQFLVGFDGPLEVAATIVAAALAAYGVWLLFRYVNERERRGAALAARIGLLGVGVPLLLAIVGIDYLITRNVIAAWMPLALVVAAGLGAVRAGAVATAALCAVMLAVVVGVDANPVYQRADWRGAADALGPSPAPGRVLVITPAAGSEALGVYAPGLALMQGPVTAREIDLVATAERRNGASPAPPRPDPLRPPPPGFGAPAVTLGKTYTVVRYRSLDPAGAPVDIPVAGSLQFAPGAADFRVQPPSR